jgi:PQQ-like domain
LKCGNDCGCECSAFAGDGQLATAPIVVNNYVFIGSQSGNLYALDASTGQWSRTMFWKRKQKDPIETSADALYAALKTTITQGGRIRVEDLISAAAAIVGEAAITRAADFDPRRHEYPPGARVFSTKINTLICDDESLQEAPSDSIIGDLRDRLYGCGFALSDFPNLEDVFSHFAANIGKKEDWGRVPLSIEQQHRPFAQPLRIAYESRSIVDSSLAPLGDDPARRLRAATAVLARALCETRDVLARNAATTLAIETINGMAKTAPMTDAMMTKLRESANTVSF